MFCFDPSKTTFVLNLWIDYCSLLPQPKYYQALIYVSSVLTIDASRLRRVHIVAREM